MGIRNTRGRKNADCHSRCAHRLRNDMVLLCHSERSEESFLDSSVAVLPQNDKEGKTLAMTNESWACQAASPTRLIYKIHKEMSIAAEKTGEFSVSCTIIAKYFRAALRLVKA